MSMVRSTLIAAIFVATTAALWAQAAVTPADLTRLETTAADIDKQLAQLKKTDPTLATGVERQLADLREDITYLKVKLRREGSVTRSDYADVRDKLETLRIRASGERVSAQPIFEDTPASRKGPGAVDVGTQFDLRLQTPLNSGTARIEQRFEATSVIDLKNGKDVLIPAGTLFRGFVSSVRAAGRIDRKGTLTLSFDEIVLGENHLRVRATVMQTLDGKIGDDAARIGAGAVVGAIIGGLIGGGKGALIGVMVGGGGTIASTEGSDVDLPVGTILRVRIDQPVAIPIR